MVASSMPNETIGHDRNEGQSDLPRGHHAVSGSKLGTAHLEVVLVPLAD
jgi:hypothetical protein